jgi:hypothetical protein
VLESVVDHRAGEPDEMEAAGSAEPVEGGGTGPWPTLDRHDAPAHQDDQPPPPAPRAARRDNPLVAGLVKAMREAAEASRSETISALRTEATAQVEAVRSGATDEAAALRQRADDDIAGIREWAKAETARIKQESEQRIVDRRETLEGELEAHARDVDAQAAQVEAAVEAYEAEMESFFEQLLAETDPARLATLAERAPEPPVLTELPAVRRVTAKAQEDVAPPDLEPAAEADEAEETIDALELGDIRVEFDANAPGVSDEDETVDVDEALGPEAAAAAEAEALGELGVGTADAEPPVADADEDAQSDALAPPQPSEPGRQKVIVSGLATVAGISAFKSALGQIAGVQGVSVMAGEPGTFVFTVVHDAAMDLRAALPGLPGFDASITADDGDTVRVSAQEPAA